MIASMVLFTLIGTSSEIQDPEVIVEKKIIYKKVTEMELDPSQVDGLRALPPGFSIYSVQAPSTEDLLWERLKLKFSSFNVFGF